MTRATFPSPIAAALGLAALSAAACHPSAPAPAGTTASTAAVAVAAAAVQEAPVERTVRATGTLTADEQADVAAEVGGRIAAAPVERGSIVAAGAPLLQIVPDEARAQAAEADANARQLEARLGIARGGSFDPDQVPEVRAAKATADLTQSELARFRGLLDQRVISPSEFEQRRTQADAARQQYEAARNGATQQFHALDAARARASLSAKLLADTTVRAPFAGVVAERLVSVGDYVQKGTRVAVVVRTQPLRLQLTVPEQLARAVQPGAAVTFDVDTTPGRAFTGTVRFVSPTISASQRALTVEAIVPNADHALAAGAFVSARIGQGTTSSGLFVPTAAIIGTGTATRVFVVTGDHVETRLVTTGVTQGTTTEITSGLAAGDRVATTHLDQLADGVKVS